MHKAQMTCASDLDERTRSPKSVSKPGVSYQGACMQVASYPGPLRYYPSCGWHALIKNAEVLQLHYKKVNTGSEGRCQRRQPAGEKGRN